jgi:hypothetical protein
MKAGVPSGGTPLSPCEKWNAVMKRFEGKIRPAVASALLLMSLMLPGGATAVEDYRVTDDIVLTDLQVSQAKAGRRARITFTLENRGAERVTFNGLTIANTARARIVGSLGGEATTTLNSIPVGPDEVLPVDGKALWIEVDGLASDLVPGTSMDAKVLLGTGAIPINLPVSLGSEPSS